MVKFGYRPRRTANATPTTPNGNRRLSNRRFVGIAGSLLFAASTIGLTAPATTAAAEPIVTSFALAGTAAIGDGATDLSEAALVSGTSTYGAPTRTTVRVNADVGNLRAAPDIDSNRTGRVYADQVLEVISSVDGWYHIRTSGGRTGWVSTDIVTQVSSPSADVTSETNVNASDTATTTGLEIARYASQFIGYAYRYGGTGPRAFDCSGLTRYVYLHLGYDLPHIASAQWAQAGERIYSISALRPGDLVFFAHTAGPGITHAAIYVGNGNIVTANSPRTGVQLSNLYDSYWRAHWYAGLRLAH